MLGIVVFTIGRPSETYIAAHIEALYPSRTSVCCLAVNPTPSWVPSRPTTELGTSRWRCVRGIRNLLAITTPAGLQRLDSARLATWLVSNRVRVVLCEFLQVAVTIIPICRRLAIPIVAHAHGYDVTAQPLQAGWADRYRKYLPEMDEVVVVSRAMRERVVELGARRESVHVIPCGAAPSVNAPQRTYANKETYTCLAVGRLIEKKGPILLLDSFRRLVAAGADAHLCVIGDGPFRAPMEQYLTATGLRTRVSLLGALPNAAVRQHLRRADVFLQHSLTASDGDEEGLPVAILEAMAEGLPVVSTCHAGIPDVVKDCESGFLVEPGDSDHMARRIHELLLDPELRSRFGRCGQAHVSSHFSQEIEVNRLRAVLGRYWS